MRLQTQIEEKVRAALVVEFLQLDNESHLHSGPATESHFKLTIVSPEFVGMSKVKRHQRIYQILAEEMPQFHALALHTFAPEEWLSQIPSSTPCKGGHSI